MARITYGPLVSGVAGAVGGVVFRGAGSGGLVQARGVRGDAGTTAQQRQRTYLQEARAAYSGLAAADALSFDWGVSEGYEFRKETGGKFASGLGGYMSWHVNRLYCGASVAAPTLAYTQRRFGLSVFSGVAGWNASGTPGLWLLNSAATVNTLAVWVCQAKSLNRVPGRPVWRLLYSRAMDAGQNWVSTGLGGERAYAYSLGAYVASRLAGWNAGTVWAVRWNNAEGNGWSYRSMVHLIEIGTAAPTA